MSIRPTPCAPAMVPRLAIRSMQRHRDAVDERRHAALERDLDVRRLVGALGGRLRQGVDLLGRLDPRILEDSALDGSAPQVRVGAVRALDGRRHGNAALPRVLDLLGPRHAPVARRRDDLQPRVERAGGHVEPHLIVALARAAVRDRGRLLDPGDLDELLARSAAGRAQVAIG